MPCRSEIDESDLYDCYKKINEITALLCWLCQKTDNKIINKNKKLSAWWEEHQEIDKRRIEEENKEKELENKKKLALSKLTDEEKKLLNIR